VWRFRKNSKEIFNRVFYKPQTLVCVCVYKCGEGKRGRERERNVAIIRYVKMTLLYVAQ